MFEDVALAEILFHYLVMDDFVVHKLSSFTKEKKIVAINFWESFPLRNIDFIRRVQTWAMSSEENIEILKIVRYRKYWDIENIGIMKILKHWLYQKSVVSAIISTANWRKGQILNTWLQDKFIEVNVEKQQYLDILIIA